MKGQNLVTPEDAGKRVSFQFESPKRVPRRGGRALEFYDHEAATSWSDARMAPSHVCRRATSGSARSSSPERVSALLDELRALAVPLARRAAEIQRDGLRDGFEVSEVRRGDLVTEIDRAAELAIVDGILAERPDDAILGEEGTDRNGRRACAG